MTTHRPPDFPSDERIVAVLLAGVWYSVIPGTYCEAPHSENGRAMIMFVLDKGNVLYNGREAVLTIEESVQAVCFTVPDDAT